MIDWLVICAALVIIAALVGIFGFVAWKINMSDPLITGKKEDTNPFLDSVNDKQKKNKSGNESGKKKRKELKKPKRDNKEEDQRRPSVTFKEPSTQTSEESDNEREESEQESSAPLSAEPQLVETSTKARKRVKKHRPSTPPRPSGQVEGILVNKDEKSPVTTRAQQLSHPKLATIILHDEVELAKQHQQQTKVQAKPSQTSNKQAVPAPPAPVKKPTTNANQVTQKQQPPPQQQQQQQEQPFTTVGSSRHKAGTPPSQQQQIKSVNTTSSATAVPPPLPPPVTQQQAPVQVPHEQLAQRQPPRQQKETPPQLDNFNTNSLPVKQSSVATAASPTRLADLVKALPTSQIVVTELMSALDAFPLSTDELDIIMHKIANKQSVIKQDWSKLQHGQKVDPQAHIGQVLDESARAYEEDMKNNALKRIMELTDERNNDKRRITDLVKEANEKENNLQLLRTQLNTLQHPQQQQMQSFQAEFQRLSDENMQLKQRLSIQHQQFSSVNLMSNNNNTNNNSDSTNVQMRVLSDQIKKLSVDNGNFEKLLNTKDLLIKEGQKEKDDLLRSNQQLVQKVQESQKLVQHNEEKLVKELNENRTLHMNQLNDHKRRIEQLESDNERLRREEIVHVEPTKAAPPPTPNNEERDKFEQDINQLTKDNEQYKTKLNEIQTQYQLQESELRQEIEQLKKTSEQKQNDETQNNELAAKDVQIDALRAELEEAKTKNDSTNLQTDERLRQEQDKQKQFLVELIDQDVRNQLPNDSQDLNQWLSSYRQLFTSNIESSKRALQDESAALKRENDQLLKNMTDVESQLKEIEHTVQSKEESLFTELRSKDATLESARGENDQLNSEIQRLRAEIDRLQLLHETATSETRALKLQLNERSLVTDSSPSNPADESFEFVKQPSPPPAEIDNRAEQLNELIRSSKEALENQDSIVQQMDKHLNEMHRSGTGEISTSNVDESTVSSSSDQHHQSES